MAEKPRTPTEIAKTRIKKVRTSYYLPETIKLALMSEAKAAGGGVTASDLAEAAITAYLEAIKEDVEKEKEE